MDASAKQTWSGWLRRVAGCGLVALCVSIPMWGLGPTVSLVAPILLAVAMTAVVSRASANRAERGSSGSDVRAHRSDALAWWCLLAAGSASVVLCMAVLVAASPAWLLVWIGVLIATAPPVRTAVLRYSGQARALGRLAPDEDDVSTLKNRTAGAMTALGGVEVLHGAGCLDARVLDLDTTELCRLWRVTFWMVRDVRSPVHTVVVVTLRQAVLDELERRRPDAVERWLTSGRYGADGPARYL